MKIIKIALFGYFMCVSDCMQASHKPDDWPGIAFIEDLQADIVVHSHQSHKKSAEDVFDLFRKIKKDAQLRQLYKHKVAPAYKREVFERLEAVAGTVMIKSILYTNGDSQLYTACPSKQGFKITTFEKATNTTSENFYLYKDYAWIDGALIRQVKK